MKKKKGVKLTHRPRPAIKSPTIVEALKDHQALGAALGTPETFPTWFTALNAAWGLPLDEEQQKIFANIAGGRAPPTHRVREFWCMIGRRGAKSQMAAAIAVYQALYVRHKLSRGERGLVLVLAMSLAQARVVFDYCLGFLTSSEMLAKEIESTTTTEIRLKNGITIATHANSFRSVRGPTLCCAILDEHCLLAR